MPRHLADHHRTESPVSRVRAFLTIQRRQRPSPATLTLQRRAGPVAGHAALRHFLRIARGRSA